MLIQQKQINIPKVFFRGGFNGDIYGTVGFEVPANAFTTIPLGLFESSHPSNFINNELFIVPIYGYYSIYTSMRVTETTARFNTPSGNSGGQIHTGYGQGAHSSNIDGAWFKWAATLPNTYGLTSPRNSSQAYREATFNVDDPLRMYAYFDGNIGRIINWEIIIRLIYAL